MNRETARELLTPYLDGELDARTAALLQDYLAGDPAMQRELEQLRELFQAIATSPSIEPDDDMRASFSALLEREKKHQPASPATSAGRRWRVLTFPGYIWGAAAAACLIFGLTIGWQFAQRGEAERNAEHERTVAEMRSLQRDVNLLRSMLAAGSLANRSASYRLQTMSLAEEVGVADPELIDVLFTTLETDPSANVRIAALEALRRFQDEPAVRARLVDALSLQTDPLVQIGLIGVLVDSGADEARAPLEHLLADPDVQSVVKGAAQQGLTRL